MSAKQAVNDKLQGSVATCATCGRVVNNQIKKRFIAESESAKKIKSVNIWQSYKQERGCLVHFLRFFWQRQAVRSNRITIPLSTDYTQLS